MNRRPNLPDDLSERAFRVREARLRGLTPDQLRGLNLASPYYGVRTVDDPQTVVEHCRAFLPRMRSYVAYSGATAAALWGLPLPGRLRNPNPLDVLVPKNRTGPTGRDIRSRRIRPDLWERVMFDDLPVVPPPLLFTLLAKHLELVELIAVGDAIVTEADNYPGRNGAALATIDELREAVQRFGTGTGAALLRTAIERIRTGVESPKESELRCLMVDAGLPEPDVNVAIFENGVFLARGDLVYKRERVLVEYEGAVHRSAEAHARDAQRFRRLIAAGWRVIQVTKADLAPAALPRLIAEIRVALAAAA